ncbi:hypothetical protein [Lysobacter sp. F60174L2]|uniref:hypothetical protein n=1 Tax=Lysobacter sp. F60174L2 TaxID=3459295 RepID=UPI00403DE413
MSIQFASRPIATTALTVILLAGWLPAAAAATAGPQGASQSAPPQATPATPGATIEQWGFDPAVLVADGTELLARAPDPAIDRLFQAMHASSRDPADAQVLCRLFDPASDRSLAGLNAIASRLGQASQERFANAVAGVFVAAMQNPPQAHDVTAARQVLKAAGVRAALLNDGFIAGLDGNDHAARCDSVAMLLDVLHERPMSERAGVTRLLLGEGLQRLVEAGVTGPAVR